MGLPPAQGPALLGDPIAAFELFRRARAQGNRFTPFAALDLKPYLSIATTDGVVMLALKAAISGFTATQLKMLWNTVSDPTSDLDPDPTAGPTP